MAPRGVLNLVKSGKSLARWALAITPPGGATAVGKFPPTSFAGMWIGLNQSHMCYGLTAGTKEYTFR
jgi:hypothetical protein